MQLFGYIYKCAAQVIVWLGVQDHSTVLAVELMRKFSATEPAVRDTSMQIQWLFHSDL